MRRFNAAHRVTLAIILLLLFLSTACSKGSDSGGGGPTPATGSGSTSAPVTKTQVIGIEGGEIVADDGSWKLTVPALALRFPQEISITSDATPVGTVGSEYLKFSKAFKFEPHGLFFEQPVSFWFKYEQGDMPEGGLQEKMVGFRYVHDDSGVENTRSTVNTALNESTSQLQHFSFGFVMTLQILLVNNGTITNVNPVQNIANAVIAHFAGLTTNPTPLEEYQAYKTMLDAFIAKTEQILGYNPLFQAFPSLFPPGTTGGYSVVYNANGAESGNAPTDSTIYPTGNNATVLGNTGSMTRAYHTFAGWNTAADGSGTLYVVGASLAIASANVVLHAQWVEDAKYTITYHANTSTGGTVPIDAGQYYAGMSVIVSANTGGLYKASNTFLGWNTLSNGSGQAYAPMSTIMMPSANVDLYAVWTPQFTRLYGTAGAQTRGGWHVRDSQGNIYLVANTNGNFSDQTKIGSEDILLIKFDAAGNLSWARHVGYAGSVHNYSNVALDSDENPWITGFTTVNLHGETKTGVYDAFVTKFSKQGVRQWTRLHGVATKVTMAWQLASRGGGAMRFVGQTNGNLGGVNLIGQYDAFVTDISADGTLGSTRHFGVSGADTNAYAISIDSNGGTCLTGATSGNLHGQVKTGNSDTYTLRLDAADNVSWTKLTGYVDSTMVTMNTVATAAGECYTAGYVNTQRDGAQVVNWYDFVLIKHNAAGTVEWIQKGSNRITNSGTVHLSQSGEIFLTGSTGANMHDQILTGVKDAYLMKFDTNGNRLYTRLLGAGGVSVEAGGLSSDGAGGFYASGYTNGSIEGLTMTGTRDIFITTRFSDSAPPVSQITYAGNGATGGSAPTDPAYYVHGARVRVLYNGFSRTGHSFIGWNTSADGSGRKYRPSDELTMGASNITLYAQWRSHWTRQIGAPGAVSKANGIAAGKNDRLLVVGETNGNFDGRIRIGNKDAFLVVYDVNGQKIHSQTFGVSGFDTYALGVVEHPNSGNIYIAGLTNGPLGGKANPTSAALFIARLTRCIEVYCISDVELIVPVGGSYIDFAGIYATTGSEYNVWVGGTSNGSIRGQARKGIHDGFLVRPFDPFTTAAVYGVAGKTTRMVSLREAGSNYRLVFNSDGDLFGIPNSGYFSIYVAPYPGYSQFQAQVIGGTDRSGARQNTFAHAAGIGCIAGWSASTLGDPYSWKNGGIMGPFSMSVGSFPHYYDYGWGGWSSGVQFVAIASNDVHITNCPAQPCYLPISPIGLSDVYAKNYASQNSWRNFGAPGAYTYGAAVFSDRDGILYVAGSSDGALDGQVKTGTRDAFVTTRLTR